MQPATGRIDQFHQRHGVGGRVEEVGFGRGQRLQGERHVGFLQRRQGRAEHLGGVLHPFGLAHAGGQVPLLRRAEDHDPPAQIGAEPGQMAQIFGRLAADVGVGAGQMKALGLGQQPVQADDR